MDTLRRDAARNRERILVVAHQATSRGEALTMNAVARAADVGVGTVYRHFSSVEELEEVVVWDRFTELDEVLDRVGHGHLDRTVTALIALLVEDPLFEAVASRVDPVLPATGEKRDALVGRLASVLADAQTAGRVREDVDATTVLLLACGVAHSARGAGLSMSDDQAASLLDVVLRGFRP